MMAGSHVLIGLAAWPVTAHLLHLPPNHPVQFALCTAGALLPDIDHPDSWLGLRLRLVSAPLSRMIQHRSATHSLLVIAIGAVLLRYVHAGNWIILPLMVGALSHLAADLLTPGGVPLFWPYRRRFALPLCQTGSWREAVIVTLVCGGTLCWAAFGKPSPYVWMPR